MSKNARNDILQYITMRTMRNEILKSLYDWNPWIEGDFPKELAGYPRSYFLEPYLQINEIKILEGARRVGKSTLFYQIIENILKNHTDMEPGQEQIKHEIKPHGNLRSAGNYK